MTRAKTRKILATAFRALPKRDRRRLLAHAKAETPIACGDRATLFLTRDGAG